MIDCTGGGLCFGRALNDNLCSRRGRPEDGHGGPEVVPGRPSCGPPVHLPCLVFGDTKGQIGGEECVNRDFEPEGFTRKGEWNG